MIKTPQFKNVIVSRKKIKITTLLMYKEETEEFETEIFQIINIQC